MYAAIACCLPPRKPLLSLRHFIVRGYASTITINLDPFQFPNFQLTSRQEFYDNWIAACPLVDHFIDLFIIYDFSKMNILATKIIKKFAQWKHWSTLLFIHKLSAWLWLTSLLRKFGRAIFCIAPCCMSLSIAWVLHHLWTLNCANFINPPLTGR